MENYEDCIESRIVDVSFDENGALNSVVMRSPTTGKKWQLMFSNVIEVSGFDLAKQNIVDRITIYSDVDFSNKDFIRMAYETFTKEAFDDRDASEIDKFRIKLLNDGIKLVHLQAVYGLELFVLAKDCAIGRQ